MKSVLSKIYYTAREEGFTSLADRTARYLAYRLKRLRADNAPVFEDWAGLRGAYRGERAFLIGNGPSLNRTPLYLLGDEHTMAFNRFDLMLERIAWTPDFYAVSDDRVLDDTIDVANEMAARVEHAFFPDIHPYNVDFRGRIKDRENVHWLFLDSTGFSDRLPRCGLNKTVANVGLQILAHLGFQEIYLIGVDMDYGIPEASKIDGTRDITATADNDQNHFDPRYFGEGSKYHVPMLDETFVKFREARKFFEARGVQIYNATRGGKLEEFPRVSLEAVLGFAQEQARAKFRTNVRDRLREDVNLDINRVLWESPKTDVREVSDRPPVFTTFAADVQAWITEMIQEYVPFGPVDDLYLFVSRELVRSG